MLHAITLLLYGMIQIGYASISICVVGITTLSIWHDYNRVCKYQGRIHRPKKVLGHLWLPLLRLLM